MSVRCTCTCTCLCVFFIYIICLVAPPFLPSPPLVFPRPQERVEEFICWADEHAQLPALSALLPADLGDLNSYLETTQVSVSTHLHCTYTCVYMWVQCCAFVYGLWLNVLMLGLSHFLVRLSHMYSIIIHARTFVHNYTCNKTIIMYMYTCTYMYVYKCMYMYMSSV